MSRLRDTESDVAFRVLLRELRNRCGLTQAQLALRLGLPQSFVSKYETGERRLDFPETSVVCRALRIPMKQLVELYDARDTARRPSARRTRRDAGEGG
jgi:transcriptional regulator with XRE-family HTH domain